MKRSGKYSASKTNFSAFLQIGCSSFKLNCAKGLRVTKIVNEIKFEGVLGESEARDIFQRQLFTKYLRQTRVFI